MQRVERRQLTFAFADSSGRKAGSGQVKPSGAPNGRAWLLHKAEIKESESSTAPADEANRLLEQVASEPNMAKALLNVARNRGAAGMDGRSVEEVMKNVRSLLPKLRDALLEGKYQPGDVRRVGIPKSGGGQRGLGIPNVVDRWVQQAVLQVLQPVWEPAFHRSSHGFRPHRGARTAIAEARKYVTEGRNVVVDIDISEFFDRVNHQRLLNRLAQRVKDGRLLRLIHLMLKAKVVMPDGTKVSVEEGTPQGGPLSPLLANIVLDELDKELERRGLRFVRYADDCNIYVRSIRSGQRVMDSVRSFIERRLRLRVNDGKSSVSGPEKIHFLGFRFIVSKEGKVEVHLSKRSRKRLYARLRELTPRMWGQSLEACIEQTNKYLRGWEAYYRMCSRAGAQIFRYIDGHVRRRLRAIIIRQKKRPRHLFRHMLTRGVSERAAGYSAFCSKGIWFRSHTIGIERAYPNAWFEKRVVTLWDVYESRFTPGKVSAEQMLLFS